MLNGTVKFFNVAKGFGFITSDEGGKDVFVPAASIAAAGVSSLKAGQRVAYKTMPDTKGPKAVELKIMAPVQTPRPPQSKPAAPVASQETHKLTVYIDPQSTAAGEVLAELRRAGHEPVIVDYIASPPSKDELKTLSLLLRDSDQSLVRKYEHLFLELRLDDRFISDGEYWAAIFEHPSLINGPVVATTARAGICHSKGAVKAFLSAPPSGGARAPSKPKGLPPSLRRLVGEPAALPPPVQPAAVEKHQPKAAEVKKTEVKKTDVKKTDVKKTGVAAKPKLAAKPKAKPKSLVKAKQAPKKTARKPANKSVRKAKR